MAVEGTCRGYGPPVVRLAGCGKTNHSNAVFKTMQRQRQGQRFSRGSKMVHKV